MTSTRTVQANGISINVAEAGNGPAMLLLHGFPHTWRVWEQMIPALARTRRVIAPDLRGLGGSERAPGGYDAGTLAQDALALLDVLGVETAEVVAIDLGVPPAALLAARAPERVTRLVVMEAVLGGLPGAEDFPRPWWFGFHSVPGLAEQVVAGREKEYLGFFWAGADLVAYAGRESLSCAFEHYRAMGVTSDQLASELPRQRLRMPVTAIGARPIGDRLHRQLVPVADDLTGHVVPDCGHVIPAERPEALLEILG
jgi:pimeloyl-ACP methyl ester carboxylesterase